MSKRSIFTTITPLPVGISRELVMECLHTHTEMIDLNPLVEERNRCKPPPHATAEEYHCIWYKLTDRVQYLPGGMMSGKISYFAVFHDLPNGLQTHCYAPMGVDIKGKWTLGGTLPGEPVQPVELGLGAPLQGLYLREDVDLKCNVIMTSFVKKTLKKAHEQLVSRLVAKAQRQQARSSNSSFISSTPSLALSPSHTSIISSVDSALTADGISPGTHRSSWEKSDNLYPRPLNISSPAPPYTESMAGSHRQSQSGSLWQNLDPARPVSRPGSLSVPTQHPMYSRGHYRNHSASALPVELADTTVMLQPTSHYAELE